MADAGKISGSGMLIFQDVFRRADKNDIGAVSWDDFVSFFADGVMGKEELRSLFNEIDTHKTSNIDCGELCEYFCKHLGPFKEIYAKVEELNKTINDALLKTSQDYPQMPRTNQFAIRFLLREMLNQFSSLQRPLEAASDTLDEQAKLERADIRPIEMDAAPKKSSSGIIPGRVVRRAKRQYSTQSSTSDAGSVNLATQVDRLSSLLDRLENRVNFDGIPDEMVDLEVDDVRKKKTPDRELSACGSRSASSHDGKFVVVLIQLCDMAGGVIHWEKTNVVVTEDLSMAQFRRMVRAHTGLDGLARDFSMTNYECSFSRMTEWNGVSESFKIRTDSQLRYELGAMTTSDMLLLIVTEKTATYLNAHLDSNPPAEGSTSQTVEPVLAENCEVPSNSSPRADKVVQIRGRKRSKEKMEDQALYKKLVLNVPVERNERQKRLLCEFDAELRQLDGSTARSENKIVCGRCKEIKTICSDRTNSGRVSYFKKKHYDKCVLRHRQLQLSKSGSNKGNSGTVKSTEILVNNRNRAAKSESSIQSDLQQAIDALSSDCEEPILHQLENST